MIVSKDIGRRKSAAFGVPSTAAAQPVEIRISNGPAAFIDSLELVPETVLCLPRQFGYGQ